MKRIILISLILSFILTPLSVGIQTDSVTFAPQKAYALIAGEDPLEAFDGAGPTIPQTPNEAGKRPSCSWFEIVCGLNWLLEIIALIPIAITGTLVHISGLLLNTAVIETVVNLGTHINGIEGINIAWGTLRDLANILFIFGLLAIAISTILGLGGYGYKEMLARLIIIALIINFSMFFTKFIIDVSNIFSIQFYEAIAAPGLDGTTGIANTFTRHLGITSAWDTKPLLDTLGGINYDTNGGILLMFTYSLFVSIFFSITAFVFVFTAIMLITRSVGLILLIILSPLAFAAMVLPNTKKMAGQWWEKLWQYAIFAPMLMLMFWITASIIPGISKAFGSTGGLLEVFANNQPDQLGGVVMVMNFIIIITLIIASVIISNKLSLAGSQGITKAGKNLGRFSGQLVGRGAVGGLGFAGRNLLGRGFSKASQSEELKEAASKGGVRGFAARQALKATRFGAKGSYDVRSAPGAKAATKAAGIDLGKAQKGGYEAVLKKQTEDKVKFAGSLAPDPVIQAELKKPLEKEKEEIKDRKVTEKENKSVAEGEVKKIKIRKEVLKREGKEYSPEMETLEKDLTVAEENVGQVEKIIKQIEQKGKDVDEQIKKISSIGEDRKERYAKVQETSKIETFGIKVPRKGRVAAVAIRKGKSKNDKLTDNLKDMLKDDPKFRDSLKPEEDKD